MTEEPARVVAFAGSLRRRSFNRALIAAAKLINPDVKVFVRAHYLRERDELLGEQRPETWVVPAQQRFHAPHDPGAEADDRLIVQLELLALDGAAQCRFELESFLDIRVHVGLVRLRTALPPTLGEVHRDIGVA